MCTIVPTLGATTARWSHNIGPNFSGSRSANHRYRTPSQLNLIYCGHQASLFRFRCHYSAELGNKYIVSVVRFPHIFDIHCTVGMIYCCIMELVITQGDRFAEQRASSAVLIQNVMCTVIHRWLRYAIDLRHQFARKLQRPSFSIEWNNRMHVVTRGTRSMIKTELTYNIMRTLTVSCHRTDNWGGWTACIYLCKICNVHNSVFYVFISE